MFSASTTFWVGRVVLRDDKTNNARVKVKIFGIHPEDPLDVAPQDLPWAPVVDGTYGAVQNIPKKGEWVFGAHLDGNAAQHPIVLGRIPGYGTQLPSGSGFDGDSGYSDAESVHQLGEVPLHPAVGGENANKISGATLAVSESEIDPEVLTSAIGNKYSMPSVRVPTRDLDNRVITSKDHQNYIVLASGTAGYTQISHQSGTVFQIGDDGTILVQATTRAENTLGTEVKHVKGNFETIVSEGDYSLRVNSNGKMYYGGDLDIECENFNLTVRGNSTFNTAQSTKIKSASIDMFSHTDNINITSAGKLKAVSVGLTTLQSEAGFYVRAKDKLDMTSKSLKMTTVEEGMDFKSETGLVFDAVTESINMDATKKVEIQARDVMNLQSVGNMHINAPVVYLDDEIRMAEAGATNKYEYISATGAEKAEEDLEEVAIAPGLPTPPEPKGVSGYKGIPNAPHKKPAATDTGGTFSV